MVRAATDDAPGANGLQFMAARLLVPCVRFVAPSQWATEVPEERSPPGAAECGPFTRNYARFGGRVADAAPRTPCAWVRRSYRGRVSSKGATASMKPAIFGSSVS